MSAPAAASTKPRPANAFAQKKNGQKRPAPVATTAEVKEAPTTGTSEVKEFKQNNNNKKPKTAGAVTAAAAGAKGKSKDRFSDKRIQLMDLAKDDLYKKIVFKKPEGSKMIYFGLPNEKGGVDKAFNIVARDRHTSSGLKVLPPKGTITTYNTIFSYDATPEEYEFWTVKFLPHLCHEIWKNAVFFYGKNKGEKMMKKEFEDALDDIYESMTGDSGEMFFTGPKPNTKDPSKPDYCPSLKIKVKEDPKTQLPILDIFDKVTAKKGKAENNFAVYSHPELLKFQAEHKEHGAANVAQHNQEIAKVTAVWKSRDQVSKEVGFDTTNDVNWQLLGLSPVNGKLWFSTNLKVVNRKKLSEYKGSNVRKPGDKAVNPFDLSDEPATESKAETKSKSDDNQSEETEENNNDEDGEDQEAGDDGEEQQEDEAGDENAQEDDENAGDEDQGAEEEEEDQDQE